MEESKHDPIYDEVKESFTVKTLQEKVSRLEAENKDLKLTNQLLDSQYLSQRETQADILKTLHANLDENFTKIEEQESLIRSLEQQLEDLRSDHQQEVESTEASWNSKVQELQAKNEAQRNELDQVNEFIKMRREVNEELRSLRKTLTDKEESHAREISALDRKKAIEIDALKKDMLARIRESRDTLRAKTKDQLDSTTKRTIMENEQMTTELHFQSKETERLLDKNQALVEENAQLRRNLLIHKELEDELARRTHVYQKLIRKLHQRLKTLSLDESREEQLSRSLSMEEHTTSTTGGPQHGRLGMQDSSILLSKKGRELDEAVAETAMMREKVEKVGKENEELQQTLHMVRYEFAQYRRDHATLTQLQDQSARLVIAALYDLKNQVESGPLPEPGPEPPKVPGALPGNDWSSMSNRQRELFFRMLLEKLNQSLCSTCMPAESGGGAIDRSVQGRSSSSLPPIAKVPSLTGGGGSIGPGAGVQQTDFASFLRSITLSDTGGVEGTTQLGYGKESRAVQTSTDPADPCLRGPGRGGDSQPDDGYSQTKPLPVTAAKVRGQVREWGPRAITNGSRNLPAGVRTRAGG